MLPPVVEGPLLDLGSGNGYPGLPFAAVLPGLRLLMVEASPRKCRFLERTVELCAFDRADVLEELGPLATPTTGAQGQVVRHPAELKLNALEQKILAAVPTEPTTIDEIVRSTELPVAQVLATLSVLEMRRLVRRIGGSRVLRC